MSKDNVSIKGTKNGLVIYLETEINFEDLKNQLKVKIESGRGFFRGAKYTFHQTGSELSVENLAILNEICTDNGLTFNDEISIPQTVKEQQSATIADETKTPLPFKPSLKDTRFQTQGLNSEEELTPTIFLQHGLRSGQKIHYQGNVTILGDVNAGAEIVATGDIIVLGTLRGIAHAGALGNKDAKIIAYQLQPNQLRIASFIGRSPDQTYAKLQYPEMAHIINDNIQIEEYMTSSMKNKKSLKK